MKKSVVDFFTGAEQELLYLVIFTGIIAKNGSHYRWNYNGMYWLV